MHTQAEDTAGSHVMPMFGMNVLYALVQGRFQLACVLLVID